MKLMYRNLSPDALGITCRQNELIELALTHNFASFDFDLQAFQTQVETKGLAASARLLKGAPVKLNAGPLPIELSAVDGKFEGELSLSKPTLETAKELGVKSVQATLSASHHERTYHENFEFHRQRLVRYAEALAEYDMELNLSFLAPESHRKQFPQPFVSKPDEVIMLLQLVNQPNIKMVVDTWHWSVAGASVDLLNGINGDQIAEVRLADVPADILPSDATDDQRAMPGVCDQSLCIPVLKRMAAMEYKGAITLAPHPSQIESQRREIAVRQAEERLDQLLAQAGLDKQGCVDEEAAAAVLATDEKNESQGEEAETASTS